MPPMVAEGSVVRNYLDSFGPSWQVSTEDHLDIKQAGSVLDEDHYGLEKAKEEF